MEKTEVNKIIIEKVKKSEVEDCIKNFVIEILRLETDERYKNYSTDYLKLLKKYA